MDSTEFQTLFSQKLSESRISSLGGLLGALPRILCAEEFDNEAFVCDALCRVLLGHSNLSPAIFEEHEYQLRLLLAQLSTQLNRTEISKSLLKQLIRHNCTVDDQSIYQRAEVLRLLASCYISEHDYVYAKRYNLRSYRLFKKLVDDRGQRQPEMMRLLAHAQNNLGMSLIGAGDIEAAGSHLKAAREFREANLGATHPDTIATELNIGHWALESGRLEEALVTAYELMRVLSEEGLTDYPEYPRAIDLAVITCIWAGELYDAHLAITVLEEYLIGSQQQVGPWLQSVSLCANAIRTILEGRIPALKVVAVMQLERFYRCEIQLSETIEGSEVEVFPNSWKGMKHFD